MAVTSVMIASAALAVGVVGGVMSYQQQRKANAANREAADQARKAQEEQRAQQYAARDREMRQQAKEERIRRARIMQSAENTGTDVSSGVSGALGALSSNLSSNIGSNLGSFRAGQNIGMYNQAAADAQTRAGNYMSRSSMWGQIGSFGTSMFGAAGGFNTLIKE